MSTKLSAGRVRSTYHLCARTRRWSVGKPSILIANLLQRQFTLRRRSKAWVPSFDLAGQALPGRCHGSVLTQDRRLAGGAYHSTVSSCSTQY